MAVAIGVLHLYDDVGVRRGVEDHIGLPDAPHRLQVEAHRLIGVGVQRRLAGLDGLLHRVFEAEYAGLRLHVERFGVGADPQRNLIVEERCAQPADAIDIDLVTLIAIADIPGLRLEHPVLGAASGDQVVGIDARTQVAIALRARFVAVDRGDAPAEIDRAVPLAGELAAPDRHRIGGRRD